MQAFTKTLPGVVATEARRPNEITGSHEGPYDGYAECVKTTFDEGHVTATGLMGYFFEVIDPYSMNGQNADVCIAKQFSICICTRSPMSHRE